MRSATSAALALAAGLSLAIFVGPAQAGWPEYIDQDSDTTHWHSGISTSDGKVVWDEPFAWIVNNPLALSYNEIGFAFNNCFGGGMIDELVDIGLDPASFSSASRHNEPSYWWTNKVAGCSGIWESFYNLHYSPYAGGATARTLGEAAKNGWDNDCVGPVQLPDDTWEHPQYLFTYPWADRTDVVLHRQNLDEVTDTYAAILFGGSGGGSGNYNSLVRIHSDLLARGYTSDEIYLMYPSNTTPWGGALPASWVVDDGTTYQDMLAAWAWVRNQSTATTQVYFWSNICHGSRTYDVAGEIWDDLNEEIQVGAGYGFDLDDEFVSDIRDLHDRYGSGANPGEPYWQVICPVPGLDLSVILNHKTLMFLEQTELRAGEFLYKFALDGVDVTNLQATGNTFEFVWTGGPVDFFMAGPTTGDMANPIPEPSCALLLALCVLGLRRRSRA